MLRLVCAVAAWGLVTAAQAQGTAPASAGWSVAVQSDRHLDPLPLRHLGDDAAWQHLSIRPGRQMGYLFDELRLSRTDAAQRTWSLLARQRAVAVASEGALDLARQAESSSDPAGDRHWRADLDYLGFSGVGVEVGRHVDLGGGWQADFAVQGLSLQRLTERHLHGEAAYRASDQTYRADLQSREADNRMTFPFRQPVAGHGTALLLQGGVRWQSEGDAGDWQVDLRWRDAGWLRWRGLPQQDAALSTDLQAVDADGFVVYRPLVEGRNRQPTYRRALAPITDAALAWRSPSLGQFHAGFTWLPGWGALPKVGWQRPIGGDAVLSLGWRVHERRAELGLRIGSWTWRLASDGRAASRSTGFGLLWAP